MATPRMATPRTTTPKGERTRDTILSTAAQLVHLRSVAATSLNDVIEASGTGKSQIYHYFQNKDDMIQQVLDYRAKDFEERLGPMLEGLETWEDVEAWFAFVLKDQRLQGFVGGCPFGTMAAEVADRDEPLRLELAAFFGRWIEHIAHGLRNLQVRGSLSHEADVQALATMVLASLEGGMLLSKTIKDEAPLRLALQGAMVALRANAI
jgi:TetR/AcrR family transcriptional regulator, transcriptional repressor for nem operon